MVGSAMTRFGREGRTPADLAHEAATGALAAAGREPHEVAAVFVGCRGTGSVPSADALSVRLGLRRCGLGRDDGRRAEHVTATGAHAFHLGWRAIESGLHDSCCASAPSASARAPPPRRTSPRSYDAAARRGAT